MVLRPFARHSKSETDTEIDLDEDDGVAQFFFERTPPGTDTSHGD